MLETVNYYSEYIGRFPIIKINYKEVNITSKKNYSNALKTKFELQLEKLLKPNTIRDYEKIISLAHGSHVWSLNQEELYKQGKITIKNIITNKEDILDYLLKHSIDKKIALEIVKIVSLGKQSQCIKEWNNYLKIMRKHNCDEQFINIISKILYLPGRGQSISECLYVVNNNKYNL